MKMVILQHHRRLFCIVCLQVKIDTVALRNDESNDLEPVQSPEPAAFSRNHAISRSFRRFFKRKPPRKTWRMFGLEFLWLFWDRTARYRRWWIPRHSAAEEAFILSTISFKTQTIDSFLHQFSHQWRLYSVNSSSHFTPPSFFYLDANQLVIHLFEQMSVVRWPWPNSFCDLVFF